MNWVGNVIFRKNIIINLQKDERLSWFEKRAHGAEVRLPGRRPRLVEPRRERNEEWDGRGKGDREVVILMSSSPDASAGVSTRRTVGLESTTIQRSRRGVVSGYKRRADSSLFLQLQSFTLFYFLFPLFSPISCDMFLDEHSSLDINNNGRRVGMLLLLHTRR